jgi:C-3',4' desaturase CrtD
VSTNGEKFDAVVVGAGIAGLTAAARLGLAGRRVLVVERHNVAGGCASFYQRDGYRFDVGATLVGGFGVRGVHRRFFGELGVELPARRLEPAMVVHLNGTRVERWGDERWPAERVRAFGPAAEDFWSAQEHWADLAWDFSSRFPALPADVPSVLGLLGALRPGHLELARGLGRTLGSLLPPGSRALRDFVDLQLLITSQADADGTDLAYGATALDLAREGCFHLPEGVAAIPLALARAVRRLGSRIAYRAAVTRIEVRRGAVFGVRLADGREIRAERVIAALPVQNLTALCPEVGAAFRERVAALPQRWGAFMLYVGLPPGVVPDDLHHQTVADSGRPLGEGNSAFLSFSAPGETARARNEGRAVTLSTHTEVARWERALRDGSEPRLRAGYRERLFAALERIVPGARSRAEVAETATPATFARYTGRFRGLVGGLPASPELASLGAFSHRTSVGGLYLCGDTAFPGQSTVGATLSGNAAGRAAAW